MLRLSKDERKLLVYRYIKRYSKALVCRVMRLNELSYSALEGGITRQVEHSFTRRVG